MQTAGTARPRLPEPYRAASTIYTTEIEWQAAGHDGKVPVAVAELRPGGPFACVDLNGDGQFSSSECAFFKPSQRETSKNPEVRFDVPTRVGPFRRLPLVIAYPPSAENSAVDGDVRVISYSSSVHARGTVDIAGQKTLITLSVGLSSGGRVDPRNASIELDGNGNGRIDGHGTPREYAVADDEDVVFKVGQRYVSIDSVDETSGQFVIRERNAADYLIIDRIIGSPIPDFGFTDFDGRQRRLSEFRGKFVLLDFWGSWCAPCLREAPFLRRAYERLRATGFEIIGIDWEMGNVDDAAEARARKAVASHGMNWLIASPASTKIITEKRFRIQQFPTALLIGPDGLLLSEGEDHNLIGDRLLQTLQSFILNR